MSSSNLVLVTGGTGYIGSHVIQQALNSGYTVRATARSAKVDELAAKFGGKIEVVPFDDIIEGNYTEVLKDVKATLYLVSAAPWSATGEDLLKHTASAVVNFLQQALKAGTKKAVITSSFGAVTDAEKDERLFSDKVYTDDDWNPGTREELLKGDRSPLMNYSIAKTVQEREIWKFAESHPEMDITTIVPPFVYGPLYPGTVVSRGNLAALSTLGFQFYKGTILDDHSSEEPVTPGTQNMCCFSVDVRDVARAHVLALQAPRSSEVGRKRLIVAGPKFTWFDLIKYLHETRPQLRSRLPKIKEEGERHKIATLDSSKAVKLLGLEFTDWKKTADDSLDSILEIENSWNKQN